MKDKDRYYWLDLFRFIAALEVLLYHARGLFFVEYGALPSASHNPIVALVYLLSRIGTGSVIIFFVLSGFFVGGKAIEKIIQGTFNPTDYAIDRFTRIFLPLIPSLIFTAIIVFVINNTFNVWYFLGNLFSLQGILSPEFGGNLPLWSLSYEVWCYILFF